MKIYKKISFGCLLLLLSLAYSCKKAATLDQAIEAPLDGARVRLYNFSINSPVVLFYSNDVKISAVISATGMEAVSGMSYGGTYPVNQYAIAPLGTREIKTGIPKNLAPNGGTITSSLNYNFEDQKFYSIFSSGLYDAVNKKSESFVVEDNFPQEMDPLNAYIRIVNPCYSSSTISMVLQKSTTVGGVKTITEELPIGSGIAYKQASPFVKIPPGAWELLVTDAASGKTAVRAATTFLKERVYTIALRGNIVTASPATFLDNTVNK